MNNGPGRPINGLPTATHLLNVLQQYENKKLLDSAMNLSEIKTALAGLIVTDQMNKKEQNKNYMKKYRQDKKSSL